MDGAMQLLQGLQSSLQCPLCGELFKRPHSFGTCGHTFCYECVIDTLEGPGIAKSQCPTCQQPGWKKDLVPNYTVNNSVEHVQQLMAGIEAKRKGALAEKKRRQQGRQVGGELGSSRGRGAAAAAAPAAEPPNAAAARHRVGRLSHLQKQPAAPAAVFKRKAKEQGAGSEAVLAGGTAATASAPAAPPESVEQQAAQLTERADTQAPQPGAPGGASSEPQIKSAVGAEQKVQEQQEEQQQPQEPAAAVLSRLAVPLKLSSAEVEAQEAGAATPPTPEAFGEEWVQRMLALGTPGPELLERLQEEVARLDEAIRLCDELPCQGQPPVQQQQEQQERVGAPPEAAVAESPAAELQPSPGALDFLLSLSPWPRGADHLAERWEGAVPPLDLPAVVPDTDDDDSLLQRGHCEEGAHLAGSSQECHSGGAAWGPAGEQLVEVPESPDCSGQHRDALDAAGQQPGGIGVPDLDTAPSPLVPQQQAGPLEAGTDMCASGCKRRKVSGGQPGTGGSSASAGAVAQPHPAAVAPLRASTPSTIPSPSAEQRQQVAERCQLRQQPRSVPTTVGRDSDSESDYEEVPLFMRPYHALARSRSITGRSLGPPAGRAQIVAPPAVAVVAAAERRQPPAARQPGWGRQTAQQHQMLQAEKVVAALSKEPPKPPPPEQQQQQQQQWEGLGDEQLRRKALLQRDGRVVVPIGTRVRVMWEEGAFLGRVTGYREETFQHYIIYDDGDRDWHNLSQEEWELLSSPAKEQQQQQQQQRAPAAVQQQQQQQGKKRRADPFAFEPTGAVVPGLGGSSSSSGGAAAGEPPGSVVAAGGSAPAAAAAAAAALPPPQQQHRQKPDPYTFEPTGSNLGLGLSSGNSQGPASGGRRSSKSEHFRRLGSSGGQSSPAMVAGQEPEPLPRPAAAGTARRSESVEPAAVSGRAAGAGARASSAPAEQMMSAAAAAAERVPSPASAPASVAAGAVAPAPPHVGTQDAAGLLLELRSSSAASGSKAAQPSAAGAQPAAGQHSAAQSEQPGSSAAARRASGASAAACSSLQPARGGSSEPDGGASLQPPQPPRPPSAASRGSSQKRRQQAGAGQSEEGSGGSGGAGQGSAQAGRQVKRARPSPSPTSQQQQQQRRPSSARSTGGATGSLQERQQLQSVADLFAGAEGEQGSSGSALPPPSRPPSGTAQATPGGSPPKVIVLSFMGGQQTLSAMENIRKLRSVGRAEREEVVTARTTHVLITTDAYGLARARSMKYMMGVARGCWVLSHAWLDACVEAGSWVPERAFEVKGDPTGRDAPRKARVERAAGGGGVFEGVTAYVHGTGSVPNGRDLVRLLEAGGARVLGRLPPAGELGRVKLLVPGNHAENCSKEVARAAKELKARAGGRHILTWDWVFDSVSHWRQLPEKGKYVYK